MDNNRVFNYVIDFKEELNDLFCTIKLYYNYFPAIKDKLNILIEKLKEIILILNNRFVYQETTEKIEEQLFELFFLELKLDTNSTFYEIFLKNILTFLKIFTKKDVKTPNSTLFIQKHISSFSILYNLLIERKIEYLGVESESSATIEILRCLCHLVRIFEIYNIKSNNGIDAENLFEFFLVSNYKLFTLTRNISHLENFEKIFKKTSSIIFTSDNYKKSFPIIISHLLSKIIEISKIKDDMKNSDNDIEQNFQVETLVILLKVLILFFKIHHENLPYNLKLKITKCLIELSFWDNPKIVDLTCKIFDEIVDSALTIKNYGMRREVEILIDFIYLRRLKDYFDFLNNEIKKNSNEEEEIEEFTIKIDVLEVISSNFNILINKNHLLFLLYLSNDIIKCRLNLVNELLSSILKYFSLNSEKLHFLQKTFIYTFRTCFQKIRNICENNVNIEKESKLKNEKESNKDDNSENIDKKDIKEIGNKSKYTDSNRLVLYDSLSDKWVEIQKLVNQGKFKALYKYLCKEFDLTEISRKDRFECLPYDMQERYKKIAKSIAILIRYSYYVDINNLFETIGENYCLSKLILEEYLKTFDFKNLDILKAYELFVSTFKLTGEQFHLYNFICAFSKKYFTDNICNTNQINDSPQNSQESQNVFYFKTEEEVNTFAYSTMILNTDLHNPNIVEHMSCEEFIKNNLATGLFLNMPKEYFINIYNHILMTPLKAAKNRLGNYSKEDEIYHNLKSLHYFVKNENKSEDNILNIMDKEVISSYDEFPLINIYENLYIDPKNTDILFEVIDYFYDDLFYNVISLPQNFYELKEQNVLELLKEICDISKLLNKKEVVDKLIRTINSIIKTSSSIVPYNLFFKISMSYTKEFHSYLEIFYQAILEVMSRKLKEEKNPLRIEFVKLLDEIITKTFFVISSKKKKQNENIGLLNYWFFSTAQNESQCSFDEFKKDIYSKLDLNIDSNSKPLNLKSEELIEVSKILDILKGEEEEFIFFVTLAASKILDYQNKKEVYISLIFLKEILNDTSQKNFIKIWQNLYQIFKSKMEFKAENEESLFDTLYINFFLHSILIKYFSAIENEDYYQLLENYIEIDNSEILYIVLENNNSLIQSAINNNKHINDKIFEILIQLIYRLFSKILNDMTKLSMENTAPIHIFINCIGFLINIIQNIKDLNNLLPDSLDYLIKIIKDLNEVNIVLLLTNNCLRCQQISTLVSYIYEKLKGSLSDVNEDKWELLIMLIHFCFKCTLVENKEIQKEFLNILKLIFEEKIIIFVRYKQLIDILNKFYNGFSCISLKCDSFWDDILYIFFLIITKNDQISTSEKEIELLWCLFSKKYLISFVDENKKSNKAIKKCTLENITKIYKFINGIVKNNLANGKNEIDKGGRIIWWESTKNTIKLYFPEILNGEIYNNKISI